jgi:hypothetical protein
MFRHCWAIFRENFFVIVTLRLHFIVEWECAVDCVLCTGGVNSLWSGPALQCRPCGPAETSRLWKQRSTRSTAHSHSTIKCNLSVTITISSPWRWPSRVETCRSVLQLMIKLSLWICWWLVFFVQFTYWNTEVRKDSEVFLWATRVVRIRTEDMIVMKQRGMTNCGHTHVWRNNVKLGVMAIGYLYYYFVFFNDAVSISAYMATNSRMFSE